MRLGDGIVARAFLPGDPPWRERVAMYRRIEVERANYRAALAECLERGDASRGLRLCIALRSPWVSYGDVPEGVSWFDRFLALDADVPPRVQARARVCRGELAFELQDYATAGECARAGLEMFRAADGPREAAEAGALRLQGLVSLRAGLTGEALASVEASVQAARAAHDNWEEGLALAARAAVIARQGQLSEAQSAFAEALEVIRHNNGWGVAQTLYGFGTLARVRGDYAAALQHFRDALALYQEIDSRPEIARCLAGIGWVAMAQLDLDLAARSLADSLQLSLATGQRLAIARGIEAFAALAVIRDDLPAAVRLAAAGAALREAISQGSAAGGGSRAEALLESARQRLGPQAVAALAAEGRAMTAYEAVTFAMRLRARADGPAPGPVNGQPGQTVRPARARPGRAAPLTGAARPGRARPGPEPGRCRRRPGRSVGADRPRAADRRAGRARPVQPGHRRRADDQPGHRGPARGQHLRQARFHLPRSGRRLDGRARVPAAERPRRGHDRPRPGPLARFGARRRRAAAGPPGTGRAAARRPGSSADAGRSSLWLHVSGWPYMP